MSATLSLPTDYFTELLGNSTGGDDTNGYPEDSSTFSLTTPNYSPEVDITTEPELSETTTPTIQFPTSGSPGNGFTNQKALFYAIGQGHVHCVKELLKCCREVNSTQYSGISPLHMCAGAGHVEVMKELINHGADVNLALQIDDLSPLHICAAFGSIQCLRVLLENGANPLAQTSKSSMNALHFAAYHGRKECLEVFVEHGCDLNIPSEASGRSLLHYAAVRGEVACFRYLVEQGADLTILDMNGHSALVYAANSQQGLEIVRYFSVCERRKWLSVSLIRVDEPSIAICSERGQSLTEVEKSYSDLQRAIDQTKSFDRVPMFHFSFANEIGSGIGVVREWFSHLAQELSQLGIFQEVSSLNEGGGLFFAPTLRGDDDDDQKNEFSNHFGNDVEHSVAEISGALLALGLIHGHLVPLPLCKLLYKMLLGDEVVPEDVSSIDQEFYSKKIQYLERCSDEDLSCLDLTFTQMESSGDGRSIDVELKPGGASIAVNRENLHEYLNLACFQRMFFQREDLVRRFVAGFHQLIPARILKAAFSVDELRAAMIGESRIPVESWQRWTSYENCAEDSLQVAWFWQAVERFSCLERENLLAFCTGSKALPLGGFQQLSVDRMPFTIQLISLSSPLHFPSSRTCFNTLILPAYESFDSLFEQLSYILSVKLNDIGFGFV